MLGDFLITKAPSVIIDLGLKYTKVGFGTEPEPRKILQHQIYLTQVSSTQILL